MKRINVPFARSPYRVLIERGLLGKLGPHIVSLLPGGISRVFVITVPQVNKHWGGVLAKTLSNVGLTYDFIEMKDGEQHKTLATVGKLATGLVKRGADRNSVIMALGGGVVGDVAGFVASAYMRGITCLQVPSTFLAQVDSSIGGKTGVNLPSGKNLIGAFHQPRGVFIDPNLLTTLPEREFCSGLFESMKYGIIRSPKLFNYMEQHQDRILQRNPTSLEHVIAESVAVKAQVVAFDERESGERRILNFGHTIGHALEVETGYSYLLHGEAIAWGMVAAIHIALMTGRISAQLSQHMTSALLSYAPLPPVSVSAQRILHRLRSDKKTVGGVIHFILPVRLGEVEIVTDVTPDQVISAVDELRRLASPVKITGRSRASAPQPTNSR